MKVVDVPPGRNKQKYVYLAEYPFKMSIEDSATSNARLYEFSVKDEPESWLQEKFPCGNHQCFIGHTEVMLGCVGTRPLLNMFSASMFFNAGAHILRCAMATKKWLFNTLKLRQGSPSESDLLFVQELKSMLLKWEGAEAAAMRSQRRMSQAHRARANSKSVFKQAMDQFFARVQGGFSMDSGGFVVYVLETTLFVLLSEHTYETLPPMALSKVVSPKKNEG